MMPKLRPIPFPTPESTIEALMYELRRGLSCLSDPANRHRLQCCDGNAMQEIAARLLDMKARSNGARENWTEQDVSTLIDAWEAVQ